MCVITDADISLNGDDWGFRDEDLSERISIVSYTPRCVFSGPRLLRLVICSSCMAVTCRPDVGGLRDRRADGVAAISHEKEDRQDDDEVRLAIIGEMCEMWMARASILHI